MSKKIKIMTLSDHPLSPSGVAHQTKLMIDAMVKTGKFEFVCLGGAIKHEDYQPMRTSEWGEDVVIVPIDGYGNPDMIRSFIRTEKPDILWFMTDPRFFGWLWEIEDEIRPVVPMMYYHVWDNLPYPTFNRPYYDSNDAIVTISKVTDDIVRNVAPEVECIYLPHSVNNKVFQADEDLRRESRKSQGIDDKFVILYNSRNARRKQPGTLIYCFKKFLDRVGNDKARLIMHTQPYDQVGQNLESIVRELGLINGEVQFSTSRLTQQQLAALYNMADVTINIADAEGFGLSTLESLSCEKPIIVTMTGGLQQQVTDGENWFGVGIKPSASAVIGSQEIPWIYEDRVSNEDVIDALEKIYNMSHEDRVKMGKAGREYVLKEYHHDDYGQRWEKVFTEFHEKNGSWETRTNYNNWRFVKV